MNLHQGGHRVAQFRKAGLAALIAALIAGMVSYVYYEHHARYFQETNDATIQADQVAISSKLAGYVRAVAVSDNQQVTTGALLVEIDPIDYQTKFSAAEADLVSAIAAEKAAGASHEEALAGIDAAKANLQAAQANLDFENRELTRNRPLVAGGTKPASALSQLTADHDRAVAQVAAAGAALTQAERRVDSIAAQDAQLAAQADAARVRRQEAYNDLSATRLSAPITGKVASRSVRVGQYVQPGTRLMTIVPVNDIYVLANFKETQVGLMRPGQPATIRVDAIPGIEFTGKVTSVTPGTGANFSLIPPQNATGNFTKIVQRVPVRIRIDAGAAALRMLVPGLSAEVDVDTHAARKELDAIRAEQELARK